MSEHYHHHHHGQLPHHDHVYVVLALRNPICYVSHGSGREREMAEKKQEHGMVGTRLATFKDMILTPRNISFHWSQSFGPIIQFFGPIQGLNMIN